MKTLALYLLAPLLFALQAPRIGVIDFYGLREVSEERIRRELGLREGDPLPPSKGEVEVRLEKIPGVVRARLEAVCCHAGKAILYVGIEERGAPHFNYRPPPGSGITLPEEIVEIYRQYLEAYEQAARRGKLAEDLVRGHPWAADPAIRAFQERFVALAEHHRERLSDVLRRAADAEHRAIAAAVIGYAPKKDVVVDDLQYALQDSSDSVRHNAIRALTAFAVLASREPDLRLRVSPTWLIEMLNSLLWIDRSEAVNALVTLSEGRDPGMLDQVRERALPALIDMARWEHLPHALPAFILLGRLAGLPEEDIRKAWTEGDRSRVIDKVRSS